MENRNTGIDVVKQAPWGTHFCLFYETAQDLKDILVPYFAAGLANQEYCLWITSEPLGVEEAKTALAKSTGNLDPYFKRGQLEILDYRDWYVKDGRFNASRVLAAWQTRLQAAQQNGFAGLRLSGNTLWLEDTEQKDFADYEALLDKAIETEKILALCTYSLEKCLARDVLDIMSNHAFALARRNGDWQTIESLRHKKSGEVHTATEKRYRQLFDNMTEGFALHETICDAAGKPVDYRFLEINPAFESLTGLKRNAVLGKTVREVLPNIEQDWIEAFGKVALTGEPVRLERYAKPLDRYFEAYAYSPREGQFAVIFSDVSRRKKSEQALEESKKELDEANRLLEAVTEGTKTIIATVDRDLRYTFFNNAYKDEVRRLSGKEIQKGMNVLDVFADMPAQQQVVKERWASTLEGESAEYRIEFGDPDKYRRTYSVLHAPLRDAQGQIIGAGEVAVDISAQVKTEEALHQSREDLARAQTVGEMGSWRLNIRKNELVWSDESYRICGIEKGTPLTYETFLSLVHPEDRKYVDEKWQAALNGEDYDIEHRIIANDKIKWVREKAFLEFDEDGGLLGGFGIAQDIIARKAAEAERERIARELLSAEEARTALAKDLLSETSHRTRNSLAIIAGLLEMQVELLREDETAAVNLQEAIARIYTVSSLHSQLRTHGKNQLELLQALKQIADSTKRAFSSKGTRFEISGETFLCPNQAATNLCVAANELITNALKYGQPESDGKLKITINLTRDKGKLRLSVWNSGKPIGPIFASPKRPNIGLNLIDSLVSGRYKGAFVLRPKGNGNEAIIQIDERELFDTERGNC